MKRMLLGAAVLAGCTSAPEPTLPPASNPVSARVVPHYTVRLRDAVPTLVEFEMETPPEELHMEIPAASVRQLKAPPTCNGNRLAPEAPNKWLKPTGCTSLAWSASLPPGGERLEIGEPYSHWNGQSKSWFLSGDLPWIRYKGQPRAEIRIDLQRAGHVADQISALPENTGAPIYILAGGSARQFVNRHVALNHYGEVPKGSRYDNLQTELAATLARWRQDIIPAGALKRSQFNYIWVEQTPGLDPGFYASTGSDAILMQFVPDTRSPRPLDKLEAGILMTGAHEGFHALTGPVSRGKPAWVNESLASYFSYAAAQRALTGGALAEATALFEQPADISVLHAQAKLDKGDGSSYAVFYTRAARFWAAIDNVLNTVPNDSGRLAALIKSTHGMAGVDWRDPDSIASTLDPHSGGRSKQIVRCYLVDDGCPQASGKR